MPGNIILPQWGMGMNEGTVTRWLKSIGDTISKGDALVEIESTKVNAEVEATADGTLGRVNVEEGNTVPIGTVLGLILLEGETESDLPEVKPTQQENSPTADTTSPSRTERRSGSRGNRRVVITPRARRLAKELEVDIDSISTGTGPGGRITEDDVRAAAESDSSSTAMPVKEVIPLTGMRGVISKRMTESAAAALVTLHTSADITEAVSMQRTLVREWRQHRIRPQYQDLVIASTVRALRDNPTANAHITENEVRIFEKINLGFALAVQDGLLVPVIENAGEKTPVELAQSVRDLVRRAKSGGLGIAELSGSTFSLTNLGSYNIENFTPLINPPEVGILGVGRVTQQPTVMPNGDIEARSIGYFSLTFDHRAWDGAPAAEFLSAITDNLCSPEWILD